MDNINTSFISDPTIAQPLTGPSLDFLQNATREVVTAVLQSRIGDVPDATKGYILYGMVRTPLGGSDFSYTAGAASFNGEVYLFDAVASLTVNDTDVLSITTTNTDPADPITFTDLVPRNVLDTRKLTIADAASGSGAFDFDNAVFLRDFWHVIGATNEPAFENGFTHFAGGSTPAFKKEGDIVRLRGTYTFGTNNTFLFTLPVGYRPNANVTTMGAASTFNTEVISITILTTGGVRVKKNTSNQGSFDGVHFNLNF